MKSLKTKVILSAFVLLFALVATIGSTYAWFTVSSTVNVDTLSVNVTTEDSLLIRVYDGEADAAEMLATYTAQDYYTTISSSMISNTDEYSTYSSWELAPVTALGGATLNGTNYATVSPENLSILTDISGADRELTNVVDNVSYFNSSNGGYIEIKFWLLSQEAGHTVALQDFEASTNTGSADLAAAISIGTIEEDQESGTPNRHVFGSDPDYAFAFTFGQLGYLGTESTPDALDSVIPASITTVLGLHSAFFDTTSSNTSADAVTTAIGDADDIATLAANTPELITVRIWVEGWDAEATNDIMASILDVSFSFAISD